MAKTKKASLTSLIKSINTEQMAVLVLVLIAMQPLYGIFDVVTQKSDLIALFYGKATVIRFVGIGGFVLGLVNLWQRSSEFGSRFLKQKFLKNPWNLLFCLALIWSVISAAASGNVITSVFSYAYRYEGLLSYFAYAGVFLCGSMIRDDSKRRGIIDFTIAVSVILAFFTVLAHNGNNATPILYRAGFVLDWSGSFINTNHYGYYLCLILMLSAGRFADAKSLGSRIWFLFAFTFNVFILAQNTSFGPYLAVTVGLVAYFIILTVRKGIRYSVWLAAPVLAFFAVGALVNNGLMLKTFASIFGEAKTVAGTVGEAVQSGSSVEDALHTQDQAGSLRMKIWLAAFDVFKQHPIIGCGPEISPLEMESALGSMEATHNEYLQVLAEMGVIGFLFYFGAHIWFFVRNIRRTKTTDAASLIAYGAAATYLISALFGMTITVAEVFFFFVLGLANGSHTNEVMTELEKSKI